MTKSGVHNAVAGIRMVLMLPYSSGFHVKYSSCHFYISIIIIINEFHRDASLKRNFRAAVCHVLHYVTGSVRCRMI